MPESSVSVPASSVSLPEPLVSNPKPSTQGLNLRFQLRTCEQSLRESPSEARPNIAVKTAATFEWSPPEPLSEARPNLRVRPAGTFEKSPLEPPNEARPNLGAKPAATFEWSSPESWSKAHPNIRDKPARTFEGPAGKLHWPDGGRITLQGGRRTAARAAGPQPLGASASYPAAPLPGLSPPPGLSQAIQVEPWVACRPASAMDHPEQSEGSEFREIDIAAELVHAASLALSEVKSADRHDRSLRVQLDSVEQALLVLRRPRDGDNLEL